MKNAKKKISIVDICVLVLVLIFAVGIGIRYAGIEKTQIEDKKLRYVVEIEAVREFSAEALEKSESISDGVDHIYGKIVDVKVEDAEIEDITSDGEIVKTKKPERYNCYVTVESDVTKKGNIYYLDEETRVASGEWMEIITKYVKTSGTIISVEVLE